MTVCLPVSALVYPLDLMTQRDVMQPPSPHLWLLTWQLHTHTQTHTHAHTRA